MSTYARDPDPDLAPDDYDEPDPQPTGPTPGPWDWTDEGTWPDGISIAEVGDFNIIVEDGTQGSEEADARLIASAPMLLDACQEAYKAIEQIYYTMTTPHPAQVILRGLEANLKHVIEDATGEGPL